MARQSFRGAGGAGAVVLPYAPSFARDGAVDDWEMTAMSEHELEADRRIGALMVVASGVLTLVAIFVATWTFAG